MGDGKKRKLDSSWEKENPRAKLSLREGRRKGHTVWDGASSERNEA